LITNPDLGGLLKPNANTTLNPVLNANWITPQWPAPPWVKAVCTTRQGGVSNAPFDSLNLGDHVADVAEHVTKNRQILQEAIAAKPVFLSQIHGVTAVQISEASRNGTEADACFTQQKNLACTIMVADCLPVLFTNLQGDFVAAAHAGWRGLAGISANGVVAKKGVLESVLEPFLEEIIAKMPVRQAQAAIKSRASEILVWLGPCIGPHQFEVGNDVRNAFLQHNQSASVMFKPHGPTKWLADLQGLARQRLHALGISQIYGNDGSDGWCTVSNPLRFFSHRRDAVALGGSGRMAACIWLG
jgi:polyphenol oxidase